MVKELRSRGYTTIEMGKEKLSSLGLSRQFVYFNADLVVIFIGTNDSPRRHTLLALKRLKKLYPQAYVVGPPDFPTRPRIQARTSKVILIQKRVFGRRFIDSRLCPNMQDRWSDGIHFTLRGAQSWVRCVSEKLVETSR